MDALWQALVARVDEYGGRVVGVVLIVAVGWLAIRILAGMMRRVLDRGRIDPSVGSFLLNSLRTALLVVIVLGVLQQLGVATTSLLTLLGATGLAVALSLQGSLANFASGLILLSFRIVRVGDQIEVGDVRGRVTEILPFHIVLVTADNQRITVPNTQLTSSPVRNHTYLATRRVQWTLPLTPTDDVEAIKAALRSRLQADPRILPEPAPDLYVQEWTPDKRTLAVLAWTATTDYQAVQQEMLESLGLRLQEFRSTSRSAAPQPAPPPG
jgi:small conductance mechanosensitive channel